LLASNIIRDGDQLKYGTFWTEGIERRTSQDTRGLEQILTASNPMKNRLSKETNVDKWLKQQ
jgi:hypothetical protein